MIYLLYGNDHKKKSIYLKKLCKDSEPIFVSEKNVTKEMIFEYANSVSLFGEYDSFVFDGLIKDDIITFSDKELQSLKDSLTTFIFLEEKLLAPVIKKYKKYSEIEDFTTLVSKQAPKINTFSIADAFGRRDKVGAWVLYREAVSLGIASEEISGIIFWKIKTMILSGTQSFSKEELKRYSSELVSLYHKAHRGESDFVIGLEQFILSSLASLGK